MNLTDEQVNRVLAKFKGGKIIHGGNAMSVNGGWSYLPCDSLDTLIPAWEKLVVCDASWIRTNARKNKFMYQVNYLYDDSKDFSKSVGFGATLQQAAAHATCKAVLELHPELKEEL